MTGKWKTPESGAVISDAGKTLCLLGTNPKDGSVCVEPWTSRRYFRFTAAQIDKMTADGKTPAQAIAAFLKKRFKGARYQ